MNTKGLSIIVPTFNEENSVALLVQRIQQSMVQTGVPYEIIFVDDHSTDTTKQKIQALKEHHPIHMLTKKGKRGKGFSLFEGFALAQYSHIAMIDADLQYPPELLPALYEKATQTGFAVANRAIYNTTRLRKIASRANAFIFGKLLLKLHTDVQSGLKVFDREVFDHLQPHLISAWGIDIPLIHTAYNLGFTPSHVDMTFHPRSSGKSNVRLFHTSWEIAKGAIKTLFTNSRILPLESGFAYKRKRFTTHTKLEHKHTALVTIVPWQKVILFLLILGIVYGLITNPLGTAIVCIGFLSFIYFLDVLFNLYVVLKSLHFPPELSINSEQIDKLNLKQLPIYSILCPLYKEANVLPQFMEAIARLDWPKEKLEVLLLLEEDDKHTINAAYAMKLPSYFRIVIVPHSQPKTKPKACNYGLSVAKGEYIVVYDAEDKPEPEQLKKAFIAFNESGQNVVCLQAKLNYYNPHHNTLTKLFTAEYSLWFDVILPGLQSINTTIPLGGTSNHFRIAQLRTLQGWDPFNVTEDCDLGTRLFARGYKTAIIDSTTLEEANSDVKNWFRQRSRWIKGYIQTYLVQMRNPIAFIKNHGWHALIFQLIVGFRISFMFINPILWLITISYFALYAIVGPAIEALYPTAIFYMAVTSLVFGNFIYLYNYMIGSAKRGHWELVKFTFLIPLYWLMMSWSAVIAIYQLIFKPHYWEKTIHGLHLLHEEKQKEKQILRMQSAPSRAWRIQRIVDLIQSKQLLGSGLLIVSALIANILNFVYNAYLGRIANLAQFGIINLVGSFLYIAQVPFGALSKTVAHKSAFLLGLHKKPVIPFWRQTRKNTIFVAIGITVIWLIITPFLNRLFHTNSLIPYLLFAPVWIIGTVLAIDGGFLTGNLKFTAIATISITEALVKVLTSFVFVRFGLTEYVYASVPISLWASFSLAWFLSTRVKGEKSKLHIGPTALQLPKKFFATSILSSLSAISYLSVDLLFAKHFLSPAEAGAYSFLTLAGKMVFFLSGLFGQFTVPLISHEQGAKSASNTFNKLLIVIISTNALAVLLFGVLGFITVPFLWGSNASYIVSYLPAYTMGMACYALAGFIITYNQVRGRFAFPVAGFLLSFIQIVGMMLFHENIASLTRVMAISAYITLVSIVLLHEGYDTFTTVYKNAIDFFGLFSTLPKTPKKLPDSLNILLFNWRDTKHKWSGGAEVYIHELAKRWVKYGHKVTIFCGNDQHSKRYETIDDVSIIRRGGFYTVYIWACLYYVRFFRNQYDIIIDSENGIPFFTPLYARQKIYLLIHHVHQEVFRNSLLPPFSWFAQFLEKRIMPLVYANTEVITVSPSSQKEILSNKLTKKMPTVIYNGVDFSFFKPGKKSPNPTVLYLGRLTSAKSINVLLESIKKIITWIPEVSLTIAGDGPEIQKLKSLTTQLQLNKHVTFTGKVSNEEKIMLMQASWVFVNPSLIEGWGITTIEANACGTPVIASNVAGLRDAVNHMHSGLLVPFGDRDEFAKAILKLLKEAKIRKRMSTEAINWAKKFDWDKSAQEALTLLQSKFSL